MSDSLDITLTPDGVAEVLFERPPNNHFDVALIGELADAYERLDADDGARAIVLGSVGRHFCAGADFGDDGQGTGGMALYEQAVRLFAAHTPVVAAVQGAAIGGGLGLALSADFRVVSETTRFAANFARLGIHHGFGTTVTLPGAVGQQRALELLYTGRRVKGEEAVRIGLADRLAAAGEERAAAHELAAEIALSAPLAVRSIRDTMRGHLAEAVRTATQREGAEQAWLLKTDDFAEGVASTGERRPPRFQGR